MASANMFERALASLSASPVLTGLGATTIIAVAWTLKDFHDWKSFGTGGTPPTWSGYWRMTKIRVNHSLSSDDLTDPSMLSKDGPSYLKGLPRRDGKPPRIMARTMPQRQVPEPIDAGTRDRLQSMMKRLARDHPDVLETRLSHTEGKSTDGLYAKKEADNVNPIAKDKILDHEIAHAHPADNSLHVWLSEPDARLVVEQGWGIRFPLTFVNKGWTMVFAPKNDAELEVVERITKAGVAWIAGVELP